MSEKVLTIDDSKAYKFNLPENSTFDKDYVNDLFEEIKKNRVSEILKEVNRIRLWQKKM